MKYCPRCDRVKPQSAFAKATGRADGLQSWCKTCHAELDHARYEAKVGRSVPPEPQRSERGRGAWLVSLKAGRPCTDCGRIFPHQVLQWDHRPGTEKLGELSGDFRTRTRAEILAEIAKCDLVCANCHAIRTFSRSGWATRWVQEGNALYDAYHP
jgi:hypothetical protein